MPKFLGFTEVEKHINEYIVYISIKPEEGSIELQFKNFKGGYEEYIEITAEIIEKFKISVEAGEKALEELITKKIEEFNDKFYRFIFESEEEKIKKYINEKLGKKVYELYY